MRYNYIGGNQIIRVRIVCKQGINRVPIGCKWEMYKNLITATVKDFIRFKPHFLSTGKILK